MLLRLGRFPLGFTHDLVCNDGSPYLERWILWFGWSLRVHKFLASDRDRAPHDHPWWFITMPFSAYGEHYLKGETSHYRRVSPWRLHFRSSSFKHRVEILQTPSWTIVLTGTKAKEWGFWDDNRDFVHHQDWLSQE